MKPELRASASSIVVGDIVAITAIDTAGMVDIAPSGAAERVADDGSVAQYRVLVRGIVTFTARSALGDVSTVVDARCPSASTDEIVHDAETISSEVVWSGADGVHRVRGALNIDGGTLRILDCSVVVFDPSASVVVGATLPSRLVAVSNDDAGLVLGPSTQAGWGGIVIYSARAYGSGLQRTRVRGALGVVASAGVSAALVIEGDGKAGRQHSNIEIAGLSIENCGSVGIALVDEAVAGNAAWKDVRVAGCVGAPISVDTSSVAATPSGDFMGNGEDVVLVRGGVSRLPFAVWSNPGVAYRVINDIQLAANIDADRYQRFFGTVTRIDPGVVMKFDTGTGLYVGDNLGINTVSAAVETPRRGRSALVVHGSPRSPVTLTSSAAEPRPGDWVGVVFGEEARLVMPDLALNYTTSSLNFAVLSYGGAPSQRLADKNLRGCIVALPQALQATRAYGSPIVSGVNVHHCSGTALRLAGDEPGNELSLLRSPLFAPNCFCENELGSAWTSTSIPTCEANDCNVSCDVCQAWRADWMSF